MKFVSLFWTFLLSLNSMAMITSPVLTTAVDFGGDKIAEATFTDGKNSNIEAGRGLLIGAGLSFNLTETRPEFFGIQTTVNWKFTSTEKAENGELHWDRYPVDLITFYGNHEKKVRLGVGLTRHIGNQLKGTKEASSLAMKFEDTTGLLLIGEYYFEDTFSFNLRYTQIKYAPISGTAPFNGNSLGIGLSFTSL